MAKEAKFSLKTEKFRKKPHRFAFVRSKNPFEGLDDYEFAPAIRVAYFDLGNLKKDPALFNGTLSYFGLRGISGRYFELLACGVYGGLLRKSHNYENGETIIACEPDITHSRLPIMREIKSISSKERLKLGDEQVAKYCIIQTTPLREAQLEETYGFLPKFGSRYPKITFEVFKHGLRSMNKKYGNGINENLIEALATSGRFLVSLPFSLVYGIHTLQKTGFSSRYEGEGYYKMTRINSPTLNSLLASPEKTLEQMCINPYNYTFEKFQLPRGMSVNGWRISPFPVLIIGDKNPLAWIESFISEYTERLQEVQQYTYEFSSGKLCELSEKYMPLFREVLRLRGEEIESQMQIDPENQRDVTEPKLSIIPDDGIPF